MKILLLGVLIFSMNILNAQNYTSSTTTFTLENSNSLIKSIVPLNQDNYNKLKFGDNFLKKTPSHFEENKGQLKGVDAQKVDFIYTSGDLSMYVMNGALSYQFNRYHYPNGYSNLEKGASPQENERMNLLRKKIRLETYRMKIELVGANLSAPFVTEGKSNDYINYYNHDALQVHNYSKITYKNVYDKIDWVIYFKEGQVKYDFIVHPGGNPNNIKLKTVYAEEVELTSNGSLKLSNRMGSITEKSPVSFQDGKEINTKFKLDDDYISFELENYNSTKTLIIDPTLLWASYYGGISDDGASGCTVDGSGNVYLFGTTSSITAIASLGHQNTFGGTNDAFLVKFNASGVREWSTYYGGGGEDSGNGCSIDASGNIYLSGESFSSTGIASGGHQNSKAGNNDLFLVKFNSAGVRQWGTYYGGSDQDLGGTCTLDVTGNIYLTGYTNSTSGISSGGHQNSKGSSYDAVLVKFNTSGVRQWATYYGGSGDDFGHNCLTDVSGNIYLAGYTGSSSAMALNGHQNTLGGNDDAFLVKFNESGVRQWGTYYGGSGNERGEGCAIDASGNIYLSGSTASTSLISSSGHQATNGGGVRDAFLVKFDASGVRQWGTYYGGTDYDSGEHCSVDAVGNVYLSGTTKSATAIASAAYQGVLGGTYDAFLVKFNSSGVRQWGTYYGGLNDEFGYTCSIDASGSVYLAGSTKSSNGISSGGHQTSFGGVGDAFLAKFTDVPACVPTIAIASSQGTTICSGLQVIFSTTITDGGSLPTYQWKKNGTNVGTGLATYTTSALVNGDVLTCELTSNAPCASPATVNSNSLTMIVSSTVSPTASIASSQGTTICPGTSVVFTVTPTNEGSTPTYQWKKNGTNVGTGLVTYTTSSLVSGDVITCTLISSNACASPASVISNSITMIVNSTVSPAASITSNQGTTICPGTGVIFTVTPTNEGSTPTYQWKKNGTNVGTGLVTYTTSSLVSGDIITCTLTSSNACAPPASVISNSITMIVSSPTVTIVQSAQTLTATSGFTAYQWSLNGTLISGALTNTHIATVNGTYSVVATDANGCSASATYNYNSAGVSAISAQNFMLYPNPSNGNLTISFSSSEERTIEVIDMAGKLVYTTNSIQEVLQLNLENLVPSSYNLIITNENGNRTFERLMISK